MRVWTDGQTHVIETRDGLTVQSDDFHVHEAGAPPSRWASRILGGTVPADCVAVARCDDRVLGVRMPSRRAGANLAPLRQADEGWVWGRSFPVPKAVRTDFRDLWSPGSAPFSRGRKLGQGPRPVSLSSSPWGICLADHGTGIVTALRKGATELSQAIRVPAADDVTLDAIVTQTGFLVQIVAGGQQGALVRFGPTGAHRGSSVSIGAKGEVQWLSDGTLLHAGLIDGDFRIRRLDPQSLEVVDELDPRGLDQVDVSTGVGPERDRFIVTDGRMVVTGQLDPSGEWITRALDMTIGEAPKAAEPPVLTLRDLALDVKPGPFMQQIPVVNRGGPCHCFVVRASSHDAVSIDRVTVSDQTAVLFDNRKNQTREARFDNLDLSGDFVVTVQGEARLVAEAPVEVGLYRPSGEPYASGVLAFRIHGAAEVRCKTLEDDHDYRLSADEFSALVEVMTNLGVVDTDLRTPDLGRWTDRVCRRLRVEAPPGPTSPEFRQWQDTWMQLTATDRAVRPADGRPPLFKFAADHPWHVTPEECENIVEGLRNVPNDTVQGWVSFAASAANRGGFLFSPEL
jgi:hypothetical protein